MTDEPTKNSTIFGVDKDAYTSVEAAIEAIKKENERLAKTRLPTFKTVTEERNHKLQRLVAGLRIFAKFGYDEGVAGHITVRDPENPHHFWVNPFGRYFGTLKVRDLICVNGKGEIVSGKGALNKAAFHIHSAIHNARPEVVAAVHAHSPYGKIWSTTGRLLDPITQDSCNFYEDHALSEKYNAVVYSDNEGQSIANSLGDKKGIILRNHGLIAVGETIDGALWNFINFERNCKVQMKAETIGKPALIDHDVARVTHWQTGTTFSSWFQFQPMFQMIVNENPDILENETEK